MKKEDLIAKGLSEEQAKAVLELYDAEAKDFVSKIDYDALGEQVKTLEGTVKERDKQLKDIEKNVGDNEELKKQIAALQNTNKTAADKYQQEIAQLKINSAVDVALTKAGAKTLKAVKALLDNDGIKIDKDGNVVGVEEQVKALIEGEDTKYLFSGESFKGAKIGGSSGEPKADTSKMSYEELCAYYESL